MEEEAGVDPLQASIQLSTFFGKFNATDGNEPVVMQMSTVLASERRVRWWMG